MPGALEILLATAAMTLIIWGVIRRDAKRYFCSATWKTGPEARGEMIRSLVRHHLWHGETTSEQVLALLGPSENDHPEMLPLLQHQTDNKRRLCWAVGKGEPDFLVLEFDEADRWSSDRLLLRD